MQSHRNLSVVVVHSTVSIPLCFLCAAPYTNIRPLDLVLSFPFIYGMTAYDFRQFKLFCMQLITSLEPSSSTGGTRVAVVLYNSAAWVIFDSSLLANSSKGYILEVIEGIPYLEPTEASANTTAAVQWAHYRLLSSAAADTQAVMLLATGDGIVVDSVSLSLAETMKQSMVDFFSMTVGANIPSSSQTALVNMVSGPSSTHFYQVNSFTELPATYTTFQSQMIYGKCHKVCIASNC